MRLKINLHSGSFLTIQPPFASDPKVDRMDGGQFRTVTETFRNHYDTILNYFNNRSTNAGAESFNAKVKAFRSQFRGVTDIPFFLFRLSKLCA